MPYTHCSACGAKALVGATRCPRCQVPFVSYEPGADRVVTVNCPNCGVQRPVAIGVCPNCLMSTSPSGRRLTQGLVLVGIAITVLMAVGYVMSRRAERAHPAGTTAPADQLASADSQSLRDSVSAAAADSALISRDTAPVAPPALAVATVPAPTPTPAATTPAVPIAAVTLKPAPPPSVPVSDTGRWEYAVAVTWVRVRSAPTRDSEILRMVDSAQRVRLGPPQAGWRPVRVGVDRGWVDPRFFTVVPAPNR